MYSIFSLREQEENEKLKKIERLSPPSPLLSPPPRELERLQSILSTSLPHQGIQISCFSEMCRAEPQQWVSSSRVNADPVYNGIKVEDTLCSNSENEAVLLDLRSHRRSPSVVLTKTRRSNEEPTRIETGSNPFNQEHLCDDLINLDHRNFFLSAKLSGRSDSFSFVRSVGSRPCKNSCLDQQRIHLSRITDALPSNDLPSDSSYLQNGGTSIDLSQNISEHPPRTRYDEFTENGSLEYFEESNDTSFMSSSVSSQLSENLDTEDSAVPPTKTINPPEILKKSQPKKKINKDYPVIQEAGNPLPLRLPLLLPNLPPLT